jgi:multidrug efflux system membrane fusion protein
VLWFRHAGVLLTLALIVSVTGCAKPERRQTKTPVMVATVERRTMPIELVASGTVEPSEEAGVSAQVGGVVTRIHFKEGQDVKPGQPLVSLDPRPFQAELDRTRGVLARDRAQWEAARLDAERASTLHEREIISSSEYEQKRSAADALHATVRADSGVVEGAKIDLQYATLRAPIAGRTGALRVHVGDLVATGGAPLVTIVQQQPIRVRFTLAEADLPLLQQYGVKNAHVEVRSASGDSAVITGKLVFVDNSVDRATGTLLLKGEFANRDARLFPGQFVDVRLVVTTEADRIAIPAPAVTNGPQGTYVYVLNPDSTVATRPVTVTRTQGETAIIASGVEPGDVVVTDGQFRLSPGARVVVRKGSGSGGANGSSSGSGAGGGRAASNAP